MLLSYCKQCRMAVIPFPSAEKVHLCAWNGFWQFILVSEMFASVQEINFRSIFWRKKEVLKMSWFDVSMFFRRLRHFDEKTKNQSWFISTFISEMCNRLKNLRIAIKIKINRLKPLLYFADWINCQWITCFTWSLAIFFQ